MYSAFAKFIQEVGWSHDALQCQSSVSNSKGNAERIGNLENHPRKKTEITTHEGVSLKTFYGIF